MTIALTYTRTKGHAVLLIQSNRKCRLSRKKQQGEAGQTSKEEHQTEAVDNNNNHFLLLFCFALYFLSSPLKTRRLGYLSTRHLQVELNLIVSSLTSSSERTNGLFSKVTQ